MRYSVMFFGLFLVCSLSATLAAQGKQTAMSVQVKNADMRASPSYSGKVLAKLSYADRVQVLETQGSWVRAKSVEKKLEGWINLSALSPKQILLSSGGQTKTGVDSSEVALAGKGFNKEVEANYKASGKVDYAWVDRMEGYVVPMDERVAFLKKGGIDMAVSE